MSSEENPVEVLDRLLEAVSVMTATNQDLLATMQAQREVLNILIDSIENIKRIQDSMAFRVNALERILIEQNIMRPE